MADGDILRSNVPPLFRTLSEQVREGYLSNDELICNASQGLKKSAQKYKDAPIQFLKEIADHFHQINGPLFANDIDLAKEFAQIRKTSSGYDCHKDAINFAINAAQQVLCEIQEGLTIFDPELALFEKYLQNIYIAQCDVHLRKPFDTTQPSFLSKAEISDCLDELKRGLEEPIKKFAEQLKNHGTVRKLRMPSASISKGEFDLDADLSGNTLYKES